jgi:hypothetical protein
MDSSVLPIDGVMLDTGDLARMNLRDRDIERARGLAARH